MISSISTSGADAPAVSPNRAMRSELVPIDVVRPLQQFGMRAAAAQGHFLKPLRVRRIRRADDDHRIDHRRHPFDRLLAVGRGIADVFLVGAGDAGKPPLQGRDNFRGVIDRQRGLRHIGELAGIVRLKNLRFLDGLHEAHRAGRKLADRADQLPDGRHARSG